MPDSSFVYTPPKSLEPFFASDARVRAVRGPIGSTKSTAMVMEIFRRACQQAPDDDGIRRTRFAVVRNTLSQITETCLVTMRKALGPLIRYKVSEKKVILEFNDVYSEWLFIPLDTSENIQRLLSLELTGAWISEFREIDPEIAINVYSRCGRYPAALGQGVRPTWYGLVMETNSFSEDSPWFDQLEVNKPESWHYHVQPGAYDPEADWLQYHEPHYYDDLVENNGEAWSNQYVHNIISPSLSSQAVFAQSFDTDEHVVTGLRYNGTYPLVVGLDTGRNPAAVVGQINHVGRLNVLLSLWAENMGVDTFILRELRPLMAEKFPRASIYAVADPQARARGEIGEKSVLQVINECGLSTILASTNRISPRLRAVEGYLNRREGIAIDRDGNHDLIIALQYGYRFPRDREKALKEQPDKNHPSSDLCDALQYLCLGVESRALTRKVQQFQAVNTANEARALPNAAGWT